MIKNVALLLQFMFASMLNAELNTFPIDEDGPLLPKYGRLVCATDKDNVNSTARLVVASDDDTYWVEVPCNYTAWIERDNTKRGNTLMHECGLEILPVFKAEGYSSPRGTSGSNFDHTLCRRAPVIIPSAFRGDKEIAEGGGDLFSYFVDVNHYAEFPISPALDIFNSGGREVYDYMHSEDIDRFGRFVNECQEKMRSGYRLDDNILVLCRVLMEKDGRYSAAKADGKYFGVYEMSREKYQDLCDIRASNFAEINEVGDEAAPVILFRDNGASFTITDQSQLEPDLSNPGCYFLKPEPKSVQKSQFDLDFDYIEDLLDQSQIEIDSEDYEEYKEYGDSEYIVEIKYENGSDIEDVSAQSQVKISSKASINSEEIYDVKSGESSNDTESSTLKKMSQIFLSPARKTWNYVVSLFTAIW